MIAVTLLFGFAFGFFMQHARVNRNDVITGMAVMEDWTAAKTMGLAIGIGAILVNLVVELGLASYHVKPVVAGGLIYGGLLFGFGMAVLGYCPGTLPISAGQGALDAWVGIVGGLLGGLCFTLLAPAIQPLLGPDLGAISLYSNIGAFNLAFHLTTVAVSALIIWCVFAVDKKEGGTDRRWIVSGIGLAVLNAVLILDATAGRPLGASTTYPYLADVIVGVTDNEYFRSIRTPGHWELIFLGGAMLAGLVFSLVNKEFEFRLVHSRWESYKGKAPARRILWSLIGGFTLIFGARMAGGCTSGLILSGGMQLAKSGLIFAAFAFAAFILTGKLFYTLPDSESGAQGPGPT
jgi:uncharacterized membrane protein YedE/YeeE